MVLTFAEHIAGGVKNPVGQSVAPGNTHNFAYSPYEWPFRYTGAAAARRPVRVSVSVTNCAAQPSSGVVQRVASSAARNSWRKKGVGCAWRASSAFHSAASTSDGEPRMPVR